jgi:hypothetical protein
VLPAHNIPYIRGTEMIKYGTAVDELGKTDENAKTTLPQLQSVHHIVSHEVIQD